MTDTALEPRDLQVLCLLGRHIDRAGWCARSQTRMAGEINCSRSTVQRSLDRLYEAGWVEKRRRDGEPEDSDVHPSASYAYRVRLDRDDYALEAVVSAAETEPEPSHAQDANDAGGCAYMGTPDGQGGAHPGRAGGAHTYAGTKNVPLERPLTEREREARARDRKKRFLDKFLKRWPTAALDDQQRLRYAADGVPDDEHEAAIEGIEPFLAELKRQGRTKIPAGWTYLEERRWTLIKPADARAVPAAQTRHAPGSAEAKALRILHELVGRSEAFRKIWQHDDGSVNYPKPITPRLAAIAQAGEPSSWPVLDRRQAAAWESLLRELFDEGLVRQRLREGMRAPFPWPPRVDGTLSDDQDDQQHETSDEGNAA